MEVQLSLNLDKIASGAIAVAALTVAVVVARREFFGSTTPVDARAATPPVKVSGWRKLKQYGLWIGDSTAKVVVVEFSDFECPYCRRFHEAFVKARADIGSGVALLHVHFPLASHRFAMPAALASTCAARQGRFEEFHAAVFSKQDSLGLKSWSSFAAEAGVTDTVRFASCLTGRESLAFVEAGRRVADSLDVQFTPTVIINGWRYLVPPVDSLEAILRAGLKGN